MPFVLRTEGDTENPALAAVYGKQISEGKLVYYLKEGRTKCILILGEGEMDGVDQVYYNGEALPEFASGSAADRNWRFHAGTITSQPATFYDVTAISGDTLTLSSNPFSGSTAVAETVTATGGTRTIEYLGQNTPALAYNANAAAIQFALNTLSTVSPGDITVTGTFPNFLYTFSSTATQWSNYLILHTTSLTGGTSTLSHPSEVAVVAGVDPDPSPFPVGVQQHRKLYVVYSSGSNIKLATYPGGTPITWTSSSYLLTNLKVYAATAGFFDPLQGRPEFFPTLDFTFSGICYLEVNLPAEMSEIEDEPSKFKILVRGKRLQNFDSTGLLADPQGVAYNPLALPAQTKFFSANNALVAMDIMLNAMKMEKSRIDWASWVVVRDHCYEPISWNSGTIEILGTPNFTYTNADGPVLGTVRKTAATSSWDSGALTDQSTTSLTDISVTGIYRGGNVAIGLTRKSTPPIRYNDTGNLFSIHPSGIDNNMRVYNGAGIEDGPTVYLQHNPPQIGDIFKVEINGSDVNCYKNGTLFYTQAHGLGAGTTRGFVAFSQNGSSFSDIQFFPIAGVSRNTNRFDAHLVFPQETDSNSALQQVFGRCPDVHWQDVNGLIKFIVGGNYKDVTWGDTVVAGDRVLADVFAYDPVSSSYLVPVDPDNPALATNYALAGVATASSQASVSFPVTSINNGSRTTNGLWGTSEGWNSAGTVSVNTPEWVEIDFVEHYPIQKINVVTIRDDVQYSSVSTSDTFTLYGIQDFAVQYWNGNAWSTIQEFVGNNKVIIPLTFPTIFTDKIRVYITKAVDNQARLIEVEAIGPQTISTTVPRSNIVENSFSAYKTPPENKANFLRIELRDLDDPYYTKKYVYNDRDALRDQAGQLIDFGIVPLGVCTQSLADRIGEATMRWSSDLDLFLTLKGTASTYAVSKGDIVRVAHDVPGWGLENPGQFIVIEDVIESGTDTADDKTYLVQSYNPEFYSDTKHGAITGAFPVTVSSLTPPPPLVALSLIEETRTLPDGTSYSSIVGRARFDTSYPYTQRARVFWRKATDIGFIQTSIVLEQPNTAVTEIPFELNFAPVGINDVKVVTETVTGVLSTGEFVNSIDISGTLQIEELAWQNRINCEMVGINLKKTLGTDGWDASAISTKAFSFEGMGYVQWTTTSATQAMIVGLVNYDFSTGGSNPKYGILVDVAGVAAPTVIHNGFSSSPLFGAEVSDANQSYRIELMAGNVNFYQIIDGVSKLIHVILNEVLYPLAVQVQLYYGYSLFPTIQCYGNMEQSIGLKTHWQSVRRVAITNVGGKEILTKNAPDGWAEPNSSGTFSSDRLARSGAVEWIASETTDYRMAGLSEVDAEITNPTINGNDGIAFGLYEEVSSALSVREFGTLKYNSSYVPGDILRIEREGDVIRYRKNGVLLYTSTTLTSAPLYVDTAFYSNGSTLKDLRLKRVGAFTSLPYVYPIYLVESLSITANRPQDDGSTYFELSGVFDTVEELPILRAKIRVFDKFGNLKSDLPLFTYAGNGIIGSGYHDRLYTDPNEEAIYELRLDNVVGLSAPVFFKAGSMSFSMPTLFSFATAVQALTCSPVDHNRISVNWTYSGNIDIQYRLDGAAWSSLATNISTKPYTASALVPNTYYEFRAAPTGTTSNWSNICRTKTLQAPLPAETSPPPTSLVGSLNGSAPTTSVDLSWNRNSLTNTGVKIYQDGTLIYTGSSATEITKTITGLTPNTTYAFKVKNIYAGGDSIDSNIVSITTNAVISASAPTGLTALAISAFRIDLSWTNHTSSGNIDIETSPDGSSWSALISIAATNSTWSVFGLSSDTTYYYRVKNSTVTGYSNTTSATTFHAGGGGGGGDDGGGVCVVLDTLIWTIDNGVYSQTIAKDVKKGSLVLAVTARGDIVPVKVKDVMFGVSDTIHFLTTEKGKVLGCTPSHPILTDLDKNIKRATNISRGDTVLVYNSKLDDIEVEMVQSKETLHGEFKVLIFALEEEHTFISNDIVSHNVKIE